MQIDDEYCQLTEAAAAGVSAPVAAPILLNFLGIVHLLEATARCNV